MDVCCDPSVKEVSLMWAAQTAKTESCCNNVIGYYIDHDPKSIIVMHPTLTDLTVWVEGKLNPMLNDTPALAEKVAKQRGREGANTKTLKKFRGGFLFTAWSGSPNTMRGKSSPIILCDEIDGYAPTPEGDPISLIWKRANTFGDQKKLICTSTPTRKGDSRIETRFEAGDMRRYHVPCISCGVEQTLQWSNVKWDKSETGEHLFHTARYVCASCGHEMNHKEKLIVLRKGRWIAEKPFRGHASFHLNFLYSPFLTFEDCVSEFIRCKRSNDIQTFVNTCLAETWDEGEQISDDVLYARREEYPAQVPDGALVLTCGVDVQDDRLELEIVGWNEIHESWNIDYRVLYGDPGMIDVWDELDEVLMQEFMHESGTLLQIAATCIDSGGHYTQVVYDYCKTRKSMRVFATKGVGGDGRPLVSSPSRKKTGKEKRNVDLFTIGVDDAKGIHFRRLVIHEPGPGYCHFPLQRDEEYFKQLVAEKQLTRYKKGFPVREWVKSRPRNEALDCRLLNMAALKILNPVFRGVKRQGVEAKQEVQAQVNKRLPQRPGRRIISRGVE